MNRHITREHEIIRQARIRLGLSQQQVATLVSIQIRQYQRLEYGESDVQKLGMRAGLSLCIVLELDPLRSHLRCTSREGGDSQSPLPGPSR